MKGSSSIAFSLLCWTLAVQSQLLNEVLSRALCIASCPDDRCKEICSETAANITGIPYTQEKSEANVTLQCKDVNRLALKHKPGIYVFELNNETSDVWTYPIISRKPIHVFSNLSSGTRYRFRTYKIAKQGVALPEITQWFETHEVNYTPKKVSNVSISGIKTSIGKAGHMEVNLNLNIVPADDFNCLYHVIDWGEGHHLYNYQLDATREYRLKLAHLQYNKSNTVYVISRNEIGSRQSDNMTISFMTPSCLDLHHNLSICAPAPVTGLSIDSFQSRKDSIDFQVVWEEPKLQPNNYTIIVQPFDYENSSYEVIVLGNETTATVPNVVLSRQYKIGVIAESEGGNSFQWKIFTRTEQSSVGTQVIVAISTITTVAIFLTIAYTYCRYKKIKGHECRYSFFENINRKGCAYEDVKSPLKSSYDLEEYKPKDKFEIQMDRLMIRKVLGSGISGVVKLASLQDDQKRSVDVAVKMLREDASVDDIKNFHQEILLMKSVGNHRNVVSLIGCCTLKRCPLLVVEYCSKGDLQSYLRTILEEIMTAIFKRTEFPVSNVVSNASYFHQTNKNNLTCAINNYLYDIQEQEVSIENKVTPEDLLNFARQVATGMEFLSSNRIVHRDLAARNVLVCADRTVKISDFGLSRDIYQENVYKKQSNAKLPLKWMAIEALTHQVYTTHSDVWSFGVLLYEIVTLGGAPYPGLQSSSILHALKSGYRMERPSNCGFELYKIMLSCWHENPLNRPTFKQLKQQFDTLLSTMTRNEYLNISELFRESAQHRRFAKWDRKIQNILTVPN